MFLFPYGAVNEEEEAPGSSQMSTGSLTCPMAEEAAEDWLFLRQEKEEDADLEPPAPPPPKLVWAEISHSVKNSGAACPVAEDPESSAAPALPFLKWPPRLPSSPRLPLCCCCCCCCCC